MRIPGLGRLQIHLGKEHPRDILPFMMKGNQPAADGGGITLLEGYIEASFFRAPLAASVQRSNDGPRITLAFIAPSRLRGKHFFYRVTIDSLDSQILSVQRTASGIQEVGCLEVHDEIAADNTSALASSTSYQSAPQERRKVKLSLDADSFWYQRFSSNANVRMSQFVHEMKLIYARQLNLDIVIVRQLVHQQRNFGVSNPFAILEAYQSYMNDTVHPNLFDVSHLFTASDLAGGVIGIAYIGTVCSPTAAYGVDQFTNDTVFPLTIAHELGHNFNARHSAEGIMGPVAGQSGLDTQEFSAESLNQMIPFINTLDCLELTVAPAPTPIPTPTPIATPEPTPEAPVTPTATPRPPEIPDEDSDSNAGSIPNGKPEFSFHLSREGIASLYFELQGLSDNPDECFLELRYAKRSRLALHGRRIATFPLSETQLIKSRFVPSGMRSRKRRIRQSYFVAAELICPLAGISHGMAPQRIQPALVRQRTKKLSSRQWFSALGDALIE